MAYFTSALVKFRTKYRLSDTSGPVSILWHDHGVFMIHGSTKFMYEQCKTTRNATWQTFYIAIATIYKLDLQSVFTAAMFGNKLKCRNTSKQENHHLKILVHQQSNT